MNRKINQKGKKLILLLGWLCLATCIFAQQHRLVFEEIGVKEGLPEETVKHIIQDELGFIWFPTQNGLVKYDGLEMKTIRDPEKRRGNLRLDNIIRIIKSRNGNLWMGGYASFKGLICYKPKLNKFFFIKDTLSKFRTNIEFQYNLILEDYDGNIWFESNDYSNPEALNTGTLMKYDTKYNQFTKYNHHILFKNLNYNLYSNLITSKIDSSIWLLALSGDFLKMNPSTNSFELIVKKGDQIQGTTISEPITSICSLNDGKILLCLPHHVVIWDPTSMRAEKTFNLKKHTTKEINPNIGAFQDSLNKIWISHVDGGLSKIDRYNKNFEHYNWGEGDLAFSTLPNKVVGLVCKEQNKKRIWFAIPGLPYYLRFDQKNNSFELFNSQFNDPQNSKTGGYGGRRNFYLDKSNILWIGTRPNLYKQSPRMRRFEFYPEVQAKDARLSLADSYELYIDKRNWLWIATFQGLVRYKPELDIFDIFQHDPNDSTTLPHNRTWAFFEDSQGQLWISTGNGFVKWIQETDQFKRYFYEKNTNTPFENAVGKLHEVAKNEYVSHAFFSKGIFSFNCKSEEITPLYYLKNSKKHGLNTSEIWRFHVDTHGDWWVASRFDSLGLFIRKKNTEKFFPIGANLEDSTSLTSNRVNFIYEDENANIWIGTQNGLNLFDRKSHSFHQFANDDIRVVYNVFTPSKDSVFFSNYSGSGLFAINPKTKKYSVYSEKNGLLHNNIIFSYPTPQKTGIDSRIWIPTEKGLSVFDPISRSFSNYTARDGFQLGSPGSIAVDSSGIVWIGGQKGLYKIDPAELEKKDSTLPNLVLTGLQINDKRYENPDSNILTRHISYTDAITLSHDQKNLTFEFVALHYLRPEDNQYSWKLENYDDHWSEPSLERKANYTNLSPGTYTFRVRGSNADGIWNEEGTSLQITILPPWWATGWAYLSYFMLLIGLVLLIIRWRTAALKRQRAELRARVNEQTQELKESNEQLRVAKAEAEEANEAKSTFLSFVSHELRTPLTSIIGFANLNKRRLEERIFPLVPRQDPKIDRAMQQVSQNEAVIVQEGQRLADLINDLLDLAKIESGKIEWHMADIAPQDLIGRSVSATEGLFDQKPDLKMVTQVDPDLPAFTGDFDRLLQVLLNLVSNAVKFTDSGEVRIRVHQDRPVSVAKGSSTLLHSSTHTLIHFSVSDTGPGIPPEYRDKIFERFQQVDGQQAGKPKGTGLGLPICKEIVEHHGGRIWVESESGKGSTFHFIIPLTNDRSTVLQNT